MKPFNLTACFITKCDTIVMITCIKMAGHGQQCTNNVQVLVTFSQHTVLVLIGEKNFICGKTVKLNLQSKTFAHVLAMGHHWQCTNKYTSIDVQ